MAAFTLLGIGAALGAGYLLGKKKKAGTNSMPIPPPTVRERKPKITAEKLAESTKPPDPIKAASENMATAQGVAQTARKRAKGGSAGKVSAGPVSNAQKAIGQSGTRSTLGGY